MGTLTKSTNSNLYLRAQIFIASPRNHTAAGKAVNFVQLITASTVLLRVLEIPVMWIGQLKIETRRVYYDHAYLKLDNYTASFL